MLAERRRLKRPCPEDLLIQAEKLVRKYVPITSVSQLTSSKYPGLSATIKLESETATESFKLRGAAYLLESLEADLVRRRLFVASTGNHGLGMAYVAMKLSLPITVIVPTGTDSIKISKIQSLGGVVVENGTNLDDAKAYGALLASSCDGMFIEPNDRRLSIGHATLGLELFRQVPDPDVLFFPIGSGAGISGIAMARDQVSPDSKIVGVVTRRAPAWYHSWDLGTAVAYSPRERLARGLATSQPDIESFQFLKSRLHDVMIVEEADVLEAAAIIEKELGIVPEPTGAVGVAGLLRSFRTTEDRLSTMVTVLCGGRKAP